MEPPFHPETDDTSPAPGKRPANRATVIGVAFVAAAIAAIVILHLTGVVGPGAR